MHTVDELCTKQYGPITNGIFIRTSDVRVAGALISLCSIYLINGSNVKLLLCERVISDIDICAFKFDRFNVYITNKHGNNLAVTKIDFLTGIIYNILLRETPACSSCADQPRSPLQIGRKRVDRRLPRKVKAGILLESNDYYLHIPLDIFRQYKPYQRHFHFSYSDCRVIA
jgi:hypothetical protein